MKFHFSYFWLLFLVLSFFSHALKTYLIIFVMLFIHEMAHVLTASFLGYKVDKIHIYPFGFSALIPHLDHGKPFEIFLILLSGLLMHLIFPLFITLLYKLDMISSAYCDYLITINHAILYFNLLPLYPMDGGRMLLCFIRLFINYSISRNIVLSLSFLLSLYILIHGAWNMKLMILFIIFLLIKEIQRNEEELVEFYYWQRNHFKLH